MHYHEINEISRPQTRQGVDALLRGAGYVRLGKGMFGAVYEKPGNAYVLKVFSARDKAYLEFISLAQSHRDNPHFPKFLSKVIRVTKDYYAIKMERLTPFNPHKVGDYAYALFDYIQDGVDDGELADQSELKAACDLVRKSLLSHYLFDHKDESFMMRGNTVVIADAVLDPAGSEEMRYSPEPSLDEPANPSAKKKPWDDDDDELLKSLGSP